MQKISYGKILLIKLNLCTYDVKMIILVLVNTLSSTECMGSVNDLFFKNE